MGSYLAQNPFTSMGCITIKIKDFNHHSQTTNVYYLQYRFLLSRKSLGMIDTESKQRPPLEWVQSICFMENLISMKASGSLTMNVPTWYSIQLPRLWLPLASSCSGSSKQHSQDACWPSEVDSSNRTGFRSQPWVLSKLQIRRPSLLENLPRWSLNDSVYTPAGKRNFKEPSTSNHHICCR